MINRRQHQRKRPPIGEESAVLELDGQDVPLRVRRHPRARRLTLRIDRTGRGAVITIPAGIPLAEGLEFAHRQSGWLLHRLEKSPPPVELGDGVTIPFLGEPHLIRHAPGGRGVVTRRDGEIHVSGRPEHLNRRLLDWLKKQAREKLAQTARSKAAIIERPIGRVTVRDTRSRWGSCSTKGNLSFCWRLILAPEFVLDYVAAHEVAHLIEKNHGARFWKLTGELTEDPERARAWLRIHGESLHRFV